METFTITTLLTKKDYTDYLFKEIYKKPLSILETFLGLALIVTTCLDLFHITGIYDDQPFLELGLGILLLVSPTISVLIARKSYYSNPSLSHDISYTFGEDDIKVKGLTFDSTLKWNHIVKLREFNGFLLLQSSKKSANFIKKDKLTQAQLDFIKDKVRQK